ncbi:MAG: hypothetical protein AAFP03_03505 [Cyanobacteria bacterium J06598_3]
MSLVGSAIGSSLIAPQPAYGQTSGAGQACYAVADNGQPGDGNGGILDDDTLVFLDFGTREVRAINTVIGPDGPIRNIEAMTSRPNFNELIAANGNEIGRIDPATGAFTPLGSLGPFEDFDAIVIDRNSPSQTRLLGVSKDSSVARRNVLVEATLQLDGSGQSVGVSAPRTLVQISTGDFPAQTSSIDGIALDGTTLYGVANQGPSTPRAVSAQRLVTIDQTTGALDDLGPFIDEGELINDVEDISFDLFGNLFASSGSNFSRFTNTGFIINLAGDGTPGEARNTLPLDDANGDIDFEASSCLPFEVADTGDLLVVKRITAIVSSGVETRFDTFVDQDNETADNTVFDETNGNFPVGVVQSPTALLPGDEVEYTVYVYNPTALDFTNAVLCDPITPPSILQSASVEFAQPTRGANLNFADQSEAARAPLATDPDENCGNLLDDTNGQFPSGPPGPTGGLDVGAGGGIITDSFNLAPRQVAASRFRITVGQSNSLEAEQ